MNKFPQLYDIHPLQQPLIVGGSQNQNFGYGNFAGINVRLLALMSFQDFNLVNGSQIPQIPLPSEPFQNQDNQSEQRIGSRTYFHCLHKNCQKKFNCQSSLSRHKRIHYGYRPFACHYPGCESKFSQSTSLRHHIRTHTGEKPFLCRFCRWAFATKGNLIDHERRHLNIKYI